MNNFYKIFVTVLYLILFTYNNYSQDHSELKLNCSLCHACETPTKSNPCLVTCPREKIMTVYLSPAESPSVITMNKLKTVEDLYEPVIFSHRVHAEMSEMSGG